MGKRIGRGDGEPALSTRQGSGRSFGEPGPLLCPAVMNTMGHGDAKSAVVNPNPDVDIVRDPLKVRHITRQNLASGMLTLAIWGGKPARSVTNCPLAANLFSTHSPTHT
jgi:hypothetical protein